MEQTYLVVGSDTDVGRPACLADYSLVSPSENSCMWDQANREWQ